MFKRNQRSIGPSHTNAQANKYVWMWMHLWYLWSPNPPNNPVFCCTKAPDCTTFLCSSRIQALLNIEVYGQSQIKWTYSSSKLEINRTCAWVCIVHSWLHPPFFHALSPSLMLVTSLLLIFRHDTADYIADFQTDSVGCCLDWKKHPEHLEWFFVSTGGCRWF